MRSKATILLSSMEYEENVITTVSISIVDLIGFASRRLTLT